MPMRRSARLLVHILLLSVLLNLADWPYVDEIFPGGIPVVAQSDAADPGQGSAPADNQGPDSTIAAGFQLLLPMQGVPAQVFQVPAPISQRATPVNAGFAFFLIPPRIDRPPISGTHA